MFIIFYYTKQVVEQKQSIFEVGILFQSLERQIQKFKLWHSISIRVYIHIYMVTWDRGQDRLGHRIKKTIKSARIRLSQIPRKNKACIS